METHYIYDDTPEHLSRFWLMTTTMVFIVGLFIWFVAYMSNTFSFQLGAVVFGWALSYLIAASMVNMMTSFSWVMIAFWGITLFGLEKGWFIVLLALCIGAVAALVANIKLDELE